MAGVQCSDFVVKSQASFIRVCGLVEVGVSIMPSFDDCMEDQGNYLGADAIARVASGLGSVVAFGPFSRGYTIEASLPTNR